MKTGEFRILSSANERNTRRSLQFFERVRNFFLKATRRSVPNPVPVYIVQFKNKKEYEPYSFKVAAAYYSPGASRDYIVVSKPDDETARVAVHEYVHLVARHSGANYPLWLNEGLAEFYSTFAEVGDQVVVGAIIPGRMQRLVLEPWVPLREILTADHDSPFYNENNKASQFYSEAWILVHFLSVSQEYGPKQPQLLAALADGGDSIAALTKVYDKSIEQIESDLRSYFRDVDGLNRALVYDVELENVKGKYDASPADPFDVELALADLTRITQGPDAAQERFDALAEQYPDHFEPWTGLAYLAFAHGKNGAGVEMLNKAFELGDRSERTLSDFGRAGANQFNEAATRALRLLTIQQPNNVEYKIDLARAQLIGRDSAGALGTLSRIKSVTSEVAPNLFAMLLEAQLAEKQFDDARGTAESILKLGKANDTQRNRAQSVLFQLNQRDEELAKFEADRAAYEAAQAKYQADLAKARAGVGRPDTSDDIDDLSEDIDINDAGRPVLRRRVASASNTTDAEIDDAADNTAAGEPDLTKVTHSSSGEFAELICNGTEATLVLDTNTGREQYLIQGGESVQIVGEANGPRNLACGRQADPQFVRVEFHPPQYVNGPRVLVSIDFGAAQ